MITVKQIENTFKITFDESKVQIIDNVFEKPKSGDFLKLIYSIHNLDVEIDDDSNTTIAHTKFIFRINKDKQNVVENSFWYLKDINCVYSKVDFDSVDDLAYNLEKVIREDNFGENLKSISKFISIAPSSSINDFLNQSNVDDFSVTNIMYNPKVKIAPCNEVKFDFEIQLNGGNDTINLSIEKADTEFIFYYHILDQVEEIKVKDINQLAQIIGDHLILLNQKYL
jgi:hypothetical protein